jgi:hypothetical protein
MPSYVPLQAPRISSHGWKPDLLEIARASAPFLVFALLIVRRRPSLFFPLLPLVDLHDVEITFRNHT